MKQKLIIKNPRLVTADGFVTYTPDILFSQVQRIIEKELLKRSIVTDMVEININRTEVKHNGK